MAELHHYIDQPSDWENLPPCVHIRGWCYIPHQASVRCIRLLSPISSIDGETGKFRPDVKSTLPDAPDDFTGFEIKGALSPGRQQVTIEVMLTDGTWRQILSRPVKIRRRLLPLWLGGGDWAELTFRQTSCHKQHPPHALELEKFPSPRLRPSRWPKLSIVSPSLQQAPFLAETMRGVLHQTQTRINGEYLVQDGGSTDGSLDIIRRFAQENPNPTPDSRDSIVPNLRLTAWASKPDAGQADAIMRGFAKTSGNPDDLMAWINSDDFYLPGALAFVADYFARHPDVDVIYGHRILVDKSSQEIGRWFLPAHDDEVLKRYDFVPQETMFWRRRIWDKTGGLDTSLRFAMDWDLLLRFQAAGAKIVRVPHFLACFRVHPAQKTSAQIETIGQREIDALRERTFSRQIPPAEIENDPILLRYLRRSAWIGFLWLLGFRV